MTIETDGISHKQFVEAAAYLLRETFEGSPEGVQSAYLDPGVGFFSTLDVLSAESASADFYGTTIAAQTEHAKFYLDRLCEYLHGRTEPVNWDDSWLIETVNETEWTALRGTLRASYDNALHCVAGLTTFNGMSTGMVIGMIAHTAYHLGSIRQIAKDLVARS